MPTAAAAVALVAVATGCTAPATPEPSQGAAPARPVASASPSPSPSPLPAISPDYGFLAGAVCRGEAVLDGPQPTPEDRSQVVAQILFETPAFPDLASRTDEPYVPWAITSYAGGDADVDVDLTGVNTVACVSFVPDSQVVLATCTATDPAQQPDGWEIWSVEYVVSVVDPTTAEVLAEGEPFSSSDYGVSEPDCSLVPHSTFADAPYTYMSNLGAYQSIVNGGWSVEVSAVLDAFVSGAAQPSRSEATKAP